PPDFGRLRDDRHRSGRKTLAQRAKSGDLEVKRQATWEMSGKTLTFPDQSPVFGVSRANRGASDGFFAAKSANRAATCRIKKSVLLVRKFAKSSDLLGKFEFNCCNTRRLRICAGVITVLESMTSLEFSSWCRGFSNLEAFFGIGHWESGSELWS
ncbi:MAG: hypothetical protein LCH61_09115, partial [Proteobacteria bacterium]|nr:hypothetical protein [Pseudomonadota bacterium]